MKSIKRKHKRMQSKRYFFFMCRKSVAVALCAATLFLSAMPCAGAPAAPEETTLTEDVLNAATLLEELLDFQYNSMKAELSSQITEKGWNRTFTMQSFELSGDDCCLMCDNGTQGYSDHRYKFCRYERRRRYREDGSSV